MPPGTASATPSSTTHGTLPTVVIEKQDLSHSVQGRGGAPLRYFKAGTRAVLANAISHDSIVRFRGYAHCTIDSFPSYPSSSISLPQERSRRGAAGRPRRRGGLRGGHHTGSYISTPSRSESLQFIRIRELHHERSLDLCRDVGGDADDWAIGASGGRHTQVARSAVLTEGCASCTGTP